ncbi:N-acetyltransferase [Mucilaginibacter jinjuensis]|uniref:N-acetyltransferase n=1 Tax=Mucilaginibacter jinjuensis TaxID=1176721 RepID=A0ABY7T501_9SPHI|nr:N-acetyltransferase [Mucilaginibacter jinjuensis]WCT10327.1 N-acetyltransferase [Mucilaginibacter jinjuensis]
MDSKIVTKFTIATDQGIDALLYLTQVIAREKFSSILTPQEVENYILKNFSGKVLMVEVNSMSNQWLVVYTDDKPAGFARITSKGERPKTLAQKRAIRIADFGILKEYDTLAVRQSLFNKCWSVCKPYEAVWITEYSENPFISFFESEGFIKQNEVIDLSELELQSICLVRQA